MKNRLLCFLFAFLFIFGGSSFSALDTGAIGDIYIGKNGVIVCSFSVPEKYLDKDANLVYPMEVTISKNSKQAMFTSCGTELSVVLPKDLSGPLLLEIRIGDFYLKKEVKL